MKSLFDSLSFNTRFPEPGLVVFSFGCGLGQEASALIDYFGMRLERYIGFDKYQFILNQARELNLKDPRIHFEETDLAKNLPEGNPQIIIIRNPNIYLFEEEGQRKINPAWQKIFSQLKHKYPSSALLVTTITEEEARVVGDWLKESAKINPFATPIKANFEGYGRFNLPVSADQFYFFVDNHSNPTS